MNKSEDIPYRDLIDCGTGDDRIYAGPGMQQAEWYCDFYFDKLD